MSADRPNILLIVTDQQRGDALSLAGHPVLRTPNLDFIGASGTRFRRAYSEVPSCIPARHVLMSGQSPEAPAPTSPPGAGAWPSAWRTGPRASATASA